jgi:hypothetical protein
LDLLAFQVSYKRMLGVGSMLVDSDSLECGYL